MATWPTVTDDDGSGTTGTILDQALFNSVRDYIGTAWTSVAYAAGNFTVPGGTWTVDSGDQTTYAYLNCGKTLFIQFGIATASVSGSPSYLEIAIPGGFTSASGEQYGVHWYQDGASTNGAGLILVPGSGVKFRLYKVDLSTWANATNTQYTRGCLTIEIV
jgi:hypothetical protein